MYARPSHAPRDRDVEELIGRYPFATIVHPSLVATHLPFLFANDTLYAHMARANPHAAILGDSDALVIFLGPHGYVSPSWYVDRGGDTAPTWDYAAIHCYGRPVIHDEAETERNILRLVEVMERGRPNAWSAAEITRDELTRMVRNVVSFEIPIARMDAKFKMNQGEKKENTRAAIEHLDAELGALIRKYNDL